MNERNRREPRAKQHKPHSVKDQWDIQRGHSISYLCILAAAVAATKAAAFGVRSPLRSSQAARLGSLASGRTSSVTSAVTVAWRRQHKGLTKSITTGHIFGNTVSSRTFELSSPSFHLLSSSSDTEADSAQEVKEDEDEWRTIIACFQMYKAAYGDLKVPSRFVVPGMPPWPESGWGLKLGQRVASIRSTGKYVQDDEGRRKILDDMGFLWRLRAPSPDKKMDGVTFDQIYDALKTYREHVQPGSSMLNVPVNFVVPNCEPWPESTRGLPLGKKIPTVRSKAYLKANPEAKERLSKLGFEFDGKMAANDARYNKVYSALVKYKEIYGDLLVPQPYVIPENSSEWPEDAWGLRLGARVNAIRSQGTFVRTNPERKKQLDELGFVWEPPITPDGKRRGRRKKVIDEALMGPAPPGILEGGVPGEPGDDEKMSAPISDSGDAPAATSSGSSESSASMDSLFGPGSAFGANDPFQFGTEEKGSPQWAFEDEAPPSKSQTEQTAYQPPKRLNDTLAKAADMALSVGVIQGLTESNRVIKGKIEKFVPWFNDDFGSDFVFDDVVEALTLYKSIYGDFNGLDDGEFVVPDPTASADEGLRESEIQSQSPPSNDTEVSESQQVLASSLAERWPEHLAGMVLGSIVGRIRDGSLEVKHLTDRKAQLDAIGFDWGDPKMFLDVPFDKAMCAMYAYYLIRGDLFVYEDFVMPDEEPWPTALAGYELGQTVFRLRQLQNFLEAYHPVKMRLLRMVEFVWFPELALPIDPDAPKPSADDEYVEAFGHPLYHISVVPVGTAEKILADGPWGQPRKSKSWYNYDYVKDYYDGLGLDDPAGWLEHHGFFQLAAEHEEKYGKSHYKQLVTLREKLDMDEISEQELDLELDRIAEEISADIAAEGERKSDTHDNLYEYEYDDTYIVDAPTPLSQAEVDIRESPPVEETSEIDGDFDEEDSPGDVEEEEEEWDGIEEEVVV